MRADVDGGLGPGLDAPVMPKEGRAHRGNSLRLQDLSRLFAGLPFDAVDDGERGVSRRFDDVGAHAAAVPIALCVASGELRVTLRIGRLRSSREPGSGSAPCRCRWRVRSRAARRRRVHHRWRLRPLRGPSSWLSLTVADALPPRCELVLSWSRCHGPVASGSWPSARASRSSSRMSRLRSASDLKRLKMLSMASSSNVCPSVSSAGAAHGGRNACPAPGSWRRCRRLPDA